MSLSTVRTFINLKSACLDLCLQTNNIYDTIHFQPRSPASPHPENNQNASDLKSTSDATKKQNRYTKNRIEFLIRLTNSKPFIRTKQQLNRVLSRTLGSAPVWCSRSYRPRL